MKKSLVLNRVEKTPIGCNLFNKVDRYKRSHSQKLFIEKDVSDKFNQISSQGYSYEDSKVLSHNYYNENIYKHKGKHGVYRFTKSDSTNKYKFYFGPLILAENKNLGCNIKGLGCKGGGLGCKGGGLGCKSKGGDNKQHLNFLNDEINSSEVSVLNKHFGLRKLFNREANDYAYENKGSFFINEFVKDNYEQINEQFEKDIESFYSEGLSFDSLIDMPSETDMFTQGLLFSNSGQSKIKLADSTSEIKVNLFLSRFDLWYFPKVKGLITKVLEVLYLIPVIGWILKFIFGKKDKEIKGSDIITNKNLEELTTIYDKDFNDQHQMESEGNAELELYKNNYLSKVPVTIAFKMKTSWWDRLWYGQYYNYYTYFANGMKR